MRSRGDPAQLQPGSHTGTLQGFFFSRVLRDADLRLSRCGGIERDSSFICWSWISWRAPPVSQAVTCYRSRCASFGTPELSPVGPIFMLSECSRCSHPPWEEISTDATSFDLASCFICKVNPIFYLFSELWPVNSSGGTVFREAQSELEVFQIFLSLRRGQWHKPTNPKTCTKVKKNAPHSPRSAVREQFLFLVYPWRRSSPLFAPPPKKTPQNCNQASVVSCWKHAKGCIWDLLCILSSSWVVW